MTESEDHWLIKSGDKVLLKLLPHIVDLYGIIATINLKGEKYEFSLCDLEVVDMKIDDF